MPESRQETNNIFQRQTETSLPPKTNWWLRMTSAAWDKPQETIEQREMVRRSRLLAWILLGVLIALIAFIPATLSDVASAFSVLGAVVGVIAIIFLNRAGHVTIAGIAMVIVATLATLSVIIWSPDRQIHLVYLPAYDFLVIPVILGASILPRSSAFIIAFVNIGLLYSDILLQQKSQDLVNAILAYGSSGAGILVITGRPVALLIITATIAYLWVRGMDQAVRRADRAEELRNIEQYFTRQESERTTRVEEFVQETINAIIALANGQEGLLLLSPNHPWQQQATFINTQLKQFHRLKQTSRTNNEQIAQATEMLLKLLQGINVGQQPLSRLDPRQFRTPIPLVNEISRYLYFMLQGKPAPVHSPSQPLQRERLL